MALGSAIVSLGAFVRCVSELNRACLDNGGDARGALLGGTAQFEPRHAHYTMNLLPHTTDTYCVQAMYSAPRHWNVSIISALLALYYNVKTNNTSNFI